MPFNKRFFVLCPSFHGATLVAKLLNAHPEVSSLGDTYPSNAFDQTCGCGALVSECGFWTSVKSAIGPHYSAISPAWLPFWPGQTRNIANRIRFSDYIFRKRLCPENANNYFAAEDLQELRAGYEAFLTGVHQHMPADVFVDGVKSIARLSCLLAAGTQIGGVIHIRRSANDFVGSAMRNTGRAGLIGAAEHTLRWRNYHQKVREFARFVPVLDISYEDLAHDPDAVLGRLFDFLGCAPMTREGLRPGLHQTWHFMGNISLSKFDGSIRASNHRLPALQRRVVQLLGGSVG